MIAHTNTGQFRLFIPFALLNTKTGHVDIINRALPLFDKIIVAILGVESNFGVAAGDRVTVQTGKSVAGIALFLAVLRAGAVYQPLNPAYTEAEVDYFVGDAAPTLIVAAPARQRALRRRAL